MSGLAITKPGQRWKVVVLALVVGAALLAGGALVGYASSRNRSPPAQSGSQQQQQQQQQLSGVQLPFPDSAAARQLLADPAIPGWLHDVYAHQQDSTLITADHTAALLQQLQRALQAMPAPAAAGAGVPQPTYSPASVSVASTAQQSSSAYAQHLQLLSLYQNSHTSVNPGSSSSSNSDSSSSSSGSSSSSMHSLGPEAGLQPFITAAGDLLSYLRHKQSAALLPLLRDYSRSGLRGLAAFGSGAVPAEVLRQEVQQLLQPGSLQQWYADAASARLEPAGGLDSQPQPTSGVGYGVRQGLRPSRRLQAASGVPLDLTTALLSKMQGALPQQQQQQQPQPAAAPPPSYLPAAAAAAAARPPVAEPSVQLGDGSTAAAAAAAAAGGSSGAAGRAASGGWVSPKPAPIPAAVPGGITATVVAEPEYLAFDFEDLGAEGDSFEQEEEAVAAATTGGSASDADQPTGSSSSRRSSSSSKAVTRRQGRKASLQSVVAGSRSGSGTATAAADSSPSRSSSVRTTEAAATSMQPAASAASPPPSAEPAAAAQPAPHVPVVQAPEQQVHLQATAAVQSPAALMAAVQLAPPSRGTTAGGWGVQEEGRLAAGPALCSIQQFSPAGIQRMAGAVQCPAPHLSLYAQAGWVFKPLTIPVIFHCLTFIRVLPSSVSSGPLGAAGPDAQVLLPPSWQASVAAGNLIDEANKAFFNTGIKFKLQEVRHDPQHHPYLQQPSLQAWQSCAVNAASPTTGVACLRQLARKVEGGPQALHVFVTGSRDERAYCSADAVAMGSGCRSVAPGYSSARGPWKGAAANVNWKEESVPDNFVFLSWDTFNPATANSLRFSNRGGSIFASQLAQHLGLNPTGAEDTPEGCTAQQQQQQLPAQAAWCSAFRQGRQPALAELRAASSCPVQGFGLLEASVPDNCAMAFSPTQVAALQAAVAMHRPKLIAACAAR